MAVRARVKLADCLKRGDVLVLALALVGGSALRWAAVPALLGRCGCWSGCGPTMGGA